MGLDQYLTRLKGEREEVGYWRKANAIHRWFVDNVQEGEDDCGEYEVTIKQLKDLLRTVQDVLGASVLTKGKIQSGKTMNKSGEWEPIMEDGLYIKDHTVAEKLLPTQEGFFFGQTNYDQYYYEDLKRTKKILEKAIEDGGTYYYSSSW